MSDCQVQAKSLSRSCRIGDLVVWKRLDGSEHMGRLCEWDNGTAIVAVGDGKEIAVRCD